MPIFANLGALCGFCAIHSFSDVLDPRFGLKISSMFIAVSDLDATNEPKILDSAGRRAQAAKRRSNPLGIRPLHSSSKNSSHGRTTTPSIFRLRRSKLTQKYLFSFCSLPARTGVFKSRAEMFSLAFAEIFLMRLGSDFERTLEWVYLALLPGQKLPRNCKDFFVKAFDFLAVVNQERRSCLRILFQKKAKILTVPVSGRGR